MDYKLLLYNSRRMALAQGVTPEQYDRKETWYYDETDNVKHLVYQPNKKVNADAKSCFVLGGVQAEDTITEDELYSLLGKTPGKELKSKNDLRGGFSDILRKDTLKRTLDMLEVKGWHIHFMMVQVWYFAFVDIIDSINDVVEWSFPLKALLYKILKGTPDDTVNFLGKYHYPNISEKERTNFLDGLIVRVQKYKTTSPSASDWSMAQILINCLNDAKSKNGLTFIQDETPDEWVKWFVQFYSLEIASYPNKTLILDTEKQVEKAIKDNPIEINGEVMSNYRFEDSKLNPMIQVCDYVVSILRKYAIFLDRPLVDVVAELGQFEAPQLANFKQFNNVLKNSLDYSPLYFHYITSVEMQYNLNYLMKNYGV